MSNLPFILHAAKLCDPVGDPFSGDFPANEDPLPVTLEIGAAGYLLSHGTRITDVRRETTDDN
jgi:hypothetical protein